MRLSRQAAISVKTTKNKKWGTKCYIYVVGETFAIEVEENSWKKEKEKNTKI